MLPVIPIGVAYNVIIEVAVCQLMVFLIDFFKSYPSVATVITPEAKGCVPTCQFSCFPHITVLVIQLPPSEIFCHMVT